MTIGFIQHEVCALHDMGDEHPECPQRLAAINDALIRARLMDWMRIYEAEPATRKQLALVHSEEYLDLVYGSVPEQGLFSLDPDTHMNSSSLDAALLAAGASIQATDLVMSGDIRQVFCAVRPPGHHAERGRAMGFCIFNNIALGAAYALNQYELQRVAVIDFDVHHGNGTEDIFRDDKRVLFCSSYQFPFYPFIYGDSEKGHIINMPLSAGTDSETFRKSVTEQWLPELHAFQPELIFISAGFDAHKKDPMAQVNLTDDDFAWVTKEIKTIADTYSNRRIVSSLEGGYDLHALGTSVVAHLGALLGTV